MTYLLLQHQLIVSSVGFVKLQPEETGTTFFEYMIKVKPLFMGIELTASTLLKPTLILGKA